MDVLHGRLGAFSISGLPIFLVIINEFLRRLNDCIELKYSQINVELPYKSMGALKNPSGFNAVSLEFGSISWGSSVISDG